jgi:protein SERAC1
LAYSAGRKGAKISFLRSIYTCTYGILFFGTPHHGSSKANILSIIQKLASVTIPSSVLNTESNLLNALREGSETLQDINDQFCPLMSRFRIFFFWEQERTELKFLNKADYIVTEASAAPILDNTERCGIAADHSGMCKFESPGCQGFRDVVAALKRHCLSAPDVVLTRVVREKEAMLQIRRDEAAEIIGDFHAGLALASEQDGTLTRNALGSTETGTEPVNCSNRRALLDAPGVRISCSQSAQEQRIL